MSKAIQITAMPTRKLTVGAMIGPVATELWGRVMGDIYAPIAGPETSMLIGALAAIAAAYWIKDRPNFPEVDR